MKLDKIDKMDLETASKLYQEYKDDRSDEGQAIFAKLRSRLASARHDEIHPNEDYYTIDVPLAHDGSYFTINDRAYFGPTSVPACVLEVLTYMMDQNRRVDSDRMKEGGRTVDLGSLGGRRAAAIQAE